MEYYSIHDDYESGKVHIHRCVHKTTRGIKAVAYVTSLKVDLEWNDYTCTKVATCGSFVAAQTLMPLLLQEAEVGAKLGAKGLADELQELLG
jgi:hypothetical protein